MIVLSAVVSMLVLTACNTPSDAGATTAAPPAAPTHVSARRGANFLGAGSAVVSWTAPATDNGSAITAYLVTPYVNGVATAARTFASTARAATVTSLAFGKTYVFKVSAKNALGIGPESVSSAAVNVACVGVAMLSGQADIDDHSPGTTFCLSGTHNWSLSPKSGDTFIGPAILDGAHSTTTAIFGNGASNVTLSTLEVRNFTASNQDAAISAHGTTAWLFRNLRVHDNGTSAGGTGANIGVKSLVIGGRYYNNRELGIGGGGGANGWVISYAEIDHNNFTDDSYTTANIDCGYQAGGVKWTAQNVTVENSSVHDNACIGLWADLNGNGATIRHNRVFNNWYSGIFIEISSGATVTGNNVYGNGFKSFNTNFSGCAWLWGGGITFASSDHGTISGNTLTHNCNGITGTQQNRSDGNPGLLEYLDIHGNTVKGPGGKTGAVADNGADLTSRHIVFSNNSFVAGTTFCGVHC